MSITILTDAGLDMLDRNALTLAYKALRAAHNAQATRLQTASSFELGTCNIPPGRLPAPDASWVESWQEMWKDARITLVHNLSRFSGEWTWQVMATHAHSNSVLYLDVTRSHHGLTWIEAPVALPGATTLDQALDVWRRWKARQP